MAKYIKTYCPKCGHETTHKIYTEDLFGASGIGRLFTSILTVGMSNIDTTTYCTCCSCGKTHAL